ncbi:MAG TPA: OsmC family protein [Candidatus Saccharimonadales bacterium]|nr:OsmC family protein [Candidatus Saccharimonadales bacterium]
MPTYKEVRLEHRGGSWFHAAPSSGHDYDFDDRESNRGGSPVETVLAALGSCSAMDVVSIASKKRQAIEAYRVITTGSQRDEFPQVFSEITVVHEVDGPDLSEAAIRRSIELSATKYCPVNAMLSAGATVVHHRYRIRSTGNEPYEAEGEVIATGPYRRPDVTT